jgi:SAM-dependent methyltransferase
MRKTACARRESTYREGMTHTAPHGHGQGHGHGDGQGHGDGHNHGQAEILDLDAEVLAEHIASVVAWLPVETEPTRIVDLGSGTGTGTFALLDRFPDAQVAAVDSSVEHLHRLREKASAAGLTDRVWTIEADLDATWPDLGTPDLVWASASLHHMADPARTLRQVRELLVPGGLIVVVELAGFPRFLPEGPLADLEDRAHAASDRQHAEHLPHRGADWGPVLTAAGFTVARERTITVHMEQSRSDAIGRYARTSLLRLRGSLGDALSAEDLTALDRLLEPESFARRSDLVVRTQRRVWVAR